MSFLSFGPMKSLFSFLAAKTEKTHEKIGEKIWLFGGLMSRTR
jgi:hypothetical protein